MSSAKMDVQFVEKPAFSVMGVLARVKPGDEAIMKTWTDLMGQMERIRGQVEPGVFYGAEDNMDMATNEFDYVACVEVDGEHDAPEGLAKWEFPTQTYAAFETTLPQIGEAYQYIYQEWMPASDYVRPEGPEFEYYGADFKHEVEDSPMYIYIPVVKK